MTDNWDEDECEDDDEYADEFGAAEAFDLEEQENAVEWARGGYANQARLERQREFQLAAQYIAVALSSLPAVKRVVLFGSVAAPLEREEPRYREERRARLLWVWHECNDIDLAVWVDDVTDLKAMQRARNAGLQFVAAAHGINVAHHQVDIMLMDEESDSCIGHMCIFAQCPKEGKRTCSTPGCGESPFLQRFRDFEFQEDCLYPAFCTALHEADGYPDCRKSPLLPLIVGDKRLRRGQ